MFLKKATSRHLALSSAATIALAMGAPAAFADPVQFNIEDGNTLQTALNEFARQADVELIFTSELVNGQAAPALIGNYEPEAGLQILLADSGLDFSEAASGALFITDGTNSSVTTRQGSGGAASAPTGSGEPVSVEGTVKGAITDSNLKGARVEILETGQTTATDDLGRFRFPAVAPGTYTLRISYLGRETIQETIDLTGGGDYSQAFTMGFGSTFVTSEVAVFGSRSSRAQSLNIERTAENSRTVLSADSLGSFNGTTISEALRRAPGIAFVPDEQTGDGANVIVRGIEPDLNQVTLNGIRLLDGSGLGRSPDLSSLLTESIESVTINTSLLPSDDTNGAGALIEIETKSPLDRPNRFASFGIEYGETGDDFGDELLVNGTVSRTFGVNEDFGLSLSASYRERSVTQVDYALSQIDYGEYLPEGATLITSVDPLEVFPFADGGSEAYPSATTSSENVNDNEVFLLVGSAQKLLGAHTDLRFDITYTRQETSNYAATTTFDVISDYRLLPVDELGGAVRASLVVEDPFEPGSFDELRFGPGITGDVSRSIGLDPSDVDETLNLSFRGSTEADNWTFEYGLGYTDSTSESEGGRQLRVAAQGPSEPASQFNTSFIIDEDLLADSVRQNTTNGLIVSVYDPLVAGADGQFVLPRLNADGFAFFNDVDGLFLQDAIIGRPSSGSGTATTLSGSARYDFNLNNLKYVEVGFNYQDTEFQDEGGTGRETRYTPASDDVLLSDLGIEFGPSILSRVGAAGGFDSITRDSFDAFFANADTFVGPDLLDVDIEDLDALGSFADQRGRNKTNEETFAAYVQGRVDIGKLELIGGLRVERLELNSEFVQAPVVFEGFMQNFLLSDPLLEFVSDSASQTDILPRVVANYRVNEDMVFRGSYYTTVSRPQLSNLTQRRTYTRFIPTPTFPFFGDRLIVEQGNPDLEPATTHNFGAGWEWYSGDVGVVKVNLFYKSVENPLQSIVEEGGADLVADDINLPMSDDFDIVGPDTEVSITTPENGNNTDDLYGIEFVVERQFTELPGAWSGAGILANLTYTDSETERRVNSPALPDGFAIIDGVPFNGSPEISYTAGLTYQGFGIDASLLYSYQDRRLRSFQTRGLSRFDEEVDSLDLRVDYLTELNGTKLRLFFRGEDLLKGTDDPFLETSIGDQFGSPKYYDSARFFGGRSFFGGVNVAF